ncbi:MAG TPA: cellulase family glycosylhydrolase [Polyangiaceae bacterium]|nr:cellulase family glycosylhydrolase [Polyangiaceae bacterium]
MRAVRAWTIVLAMVPCACSSSSGGAGASGGDASTADAPAGDAGGGGPDADAAGTSDTGGPHGEAGGGGDGGLPAGWLYTSGAKIYVSDGAGGGKPWMGRGVNIDDIFFCGYDNTLWMPTPDQTLETVVTGLVSGWKPTFVRMSLSMDSYPTVVSWLTNPSQYATPMTGVIDAIGANPGVYVLVTLRSDASMIGQDTADGDPEATGVPSDSTTTPDKTKFPTGTDAVYQALVDTFGSKSFVLFGLTNEPGGNKQSNATLSAAMSHAVGVIRAEEDKIGVPHHIVSVQGNGWTSDISFYAQTPLQYPDVVYEVHGYPPATASYTYSNIPVIIGEYGSLTDSNAFYSDVETKQIPNLAWDFDSYSNCSPDLLQVNQSDTNLMPTAWGTTVQTYLLAH